MGRRPRIRLCQGLPSGVHQGRWQQSVDRLQRRRQNEGQYYVSYYLLRLPYTLMIRESLNCRDVSLKRQSTSISCFFEGCHIVFCFFVLKVVDWLDYNLLFYSILLSNVSWRTRKKWVKKSEQSVFAFFLVKLFYLHNTLATENDCCLNSKYGNRITSCFT